MSRTIASLLNEVLALPAKDRALLAERLIVSLDGPTPDAVEQARIDAEWAVEIERRERDVEEGRVQMVDGDEVMRRLRAGGRS